jgi:hypothetical protein
VTELLRQGAREAELRVEVVEPELTTSRAESAAPDHLLGTFTTYYQAGQTRNANIQRLADVIDGALVLPGEQFSINGISGERRCDKGYEPAGHDRAGRARRHVRRGRVAVRDHHLQRGLLRRGPARPVEGPLLVHLPLPDGPRGDPLLPGARRPVHQHHRRRHRGEDRPHRHLGHGLAVRPADRRRGERDPRRTDQPHRAPTQTRTTSELRCGQEREVQGQTGGFTVEVVRTVERTDGSTDTRTIRTVYTPQNRIIERGAC